ncbi:FecR family protein [Parabacteroides provencensis]|uniref:FecR family protein n=1 Tax=Parabacteroides provencensis TaxID=1944636 RepID=UPI000C159AFB|nr:FecR family protein [Parabacteroides provencensis]
MDETTIYRYLSGLATDNEQKAILEWIKTSPENQAAFFDIKAVWNSKHVLNKTEYNIDYSLKLLNQRINKIASSTKEKKLFTILKYCAGVAAAILLLAVSLPFLIKSPSAEKTSPVRVYTNHSNENSIKTFFLADGTVVWLGSNSTLTCPTTFEGSTREVHLTGEAFFEVTKDPDHPFIVKAGENEIKVLGTSFSVFSREEDNTFETILMNGSIRLDNRHGEKLAILRPGQQARYSKANKSVEINEVDANALTSWRFGLISLTNVSISEILRCIEETYNVNIKMDIRFLENRIYNFSFKRSKGAQEALDQLSYITKIKAEILP